MENHRLRWALSQQELAALMGKRSHSAIHRYEQDGTPPPLDVIIGYEVIFGASLRELVPNRFREVEEAIIGRAATLWSELEGRSDHGAARKRELLLDVISRAEPSHQEA